MRYVEKWQRVMNKWLGGMELNDKIKTLERGKFLRCTKCGNYFFDKETAKERNQHPCIELPPINHTCVKGNRYIILKRSFRGLLWWTEYSKTFPPEMAVVEFFKNNFNNHKGEVACRRTFWKV